VRSESRRFVLDDQFCLEIDDDDGRADLLTCVDDALAVVRQPKVAVVSHADSVQLGVARSRLEIEASENESALVTRQAKISKLIADPAQLGRFDLVYVAGLYDYLTVAYSSAPATTSPMQNCFASLAVLEWLIDG